MKRILSIFLSLVLTAALLCPAAAAANETDGNDTGWLYITLDPGHGATARAATIPARSAAPMVITRRTLCSRSACT